MMFALSFMSVDGERRLCRGTRDTTADDMDMRGVSGYRESDDEQDDR